MDSMSHYEFHAVPFAKQVESYRDNGFMTQLWGFQTSHPGGGKKQIWFDLFGPFFCCLDYDYGISVQDLFG